MRWLYILLNNLLIISGIHFASECVVFVESNIRMIFLLKEEIKLTFTYSLGRAIHGMIFFFVLSDRVFCMTLLSMFEKYVFVSDVT